MGAGTRGVHDPRQSRLARPEPEEDDLAQPASGHAIAAMNGHGRGLIRRDLASRPDEPGLFAAHALQSGAAVPIADGARSFGVLAVYSQDAVAFADDTLHTLDGLAALAAAAIAAGGRQAADLDGERDERLRLASLVEGGVDAARWSAPPSRART